MSKEIILVFILTGAGYAAYLFFTRVVWRESSLPPNTWEKRSHIFTIIYHRITGFVCYGLVPFLIMLSAGRHPLSGYGLIWGNGNTPFYWMTILCICVLPIGILSGKRPLIQKTYPQIRISKWNIQMILISALTWILFILGYEFLLRGLLFFSCLRAFGFFAALLINTAVYALFHLHKGLQEMAGSLVFGVIICTAVYFSGNIWPAAGAHIVLALSTEWSAIFFKPDMKMTWGFKPI